MKLKYNLLVFIIVGIIGALSHFVYDWSGEKVILGYFFPVNESTWEHLKLLFFPTLIYTIFEYKIIKEKYKNYAYSIIVSLVVGMGSIITMFYTYKGVLGFNVDFLNIIIYYIALVITLIIKNKIIKSRKFEDKTFAKASIVIGFVITLLFVLFTYNPPSIALFSPPNNYIK